MSVKAKYELASIRAFYFACALGYKNPCDLAYLIDQNFGYPKDFDTALDLALTQGNALTFLIVNYTGRSEASLAFERAFVLAINRASQDYDSESLNKVIFDLNYDLCYLLDKNFSTILKPLLRKLKGQLPDSENSVQVNNWWKSNKEIWLRELRNIFLRYRNVYFRSRFKFNSQDKCLLKQYYNANKLLVHCLNDKGTLSNTLENIKLTLLLPIAEIEKRNREKAEQNDRTSPLT